VFRNNDRLGHNGGLTRVPISEVALPDASVWRGETRGILPPPIRDLMENEIYDLADRMMTAYNVGS
jgi:hypothetical protein